MPATIPVFVISLPNSKRRPIIQELLDKKGISFTFWDGVIVLKNRDLFLNEFLGVTNTKNRLNHGTLGCLLAYISLYAHLADKQIPLALILEDDILCNDDFDFSRINFEALMRMVDVDYCFLHWYPCRECGTQAQLVNLKASQFLKQNTQTIMDQNAPIDLILWEARIPLISVISVSQVIQEGKKNDTEIKVGQTYHRGQGFWLFKHAHEYDNPVLSERMILNHVHNNTVNDHNS